MEPFQYIKSLPSKSVREKLIDALNVWMNASTDSVEVIKAIVGDTHALSLMYVHTVLIAQNGKRKKESTY